jgi:hypothetical protein
MERRYQRYLATTLKEDQEIDGEKTKDTLQQHLRKTMKYCIEDIKDTLQQYRLIKFDSTRQPTAIILKLHRERRCRKHTPQANMVKE